MAKKKKHSRKKKSEATEQSSFWPLAGAVLLMVAALFLLLGGFGTGGPLPKNLFDGAYWAFGIGAYLTPLALVYWGVHKFTSEDKQIPLPKLLSMLSVLIFSASWLHVAFVTKDSFNVYTGLRSLFCWI